MANIINQYGQVKVGWRSGVAYTPPASTLSTSLYSAYNFNNNLNDSFGTNNGTGYGGINHLTNGVIDKSVGFNGANAYIYLPNNTNQFNFTDDFSISLWLKPYYLSGYPFFIGNYKTSGSNYYGYYFYYHDATSTIKFGILNGASSGDITTTQIPSLNVWSHYVITRKKSNTTKIYKNGILITPTSNTNPTLDPSYLSDTTFSLGSLIGDYKYAGWMDAVNFWTKELTQSEVTELYNSGNGKQYPF